MSTRILICRSNPIAPDPRVEKLAQALTGAGYKVEILGWDRTGQLSREEMIAGAALHRLPIRAAFGRGLMNFPALLRWQVGLTNWLLRHRRRFAAIHACDFDTLLPTLLFRRLLGVRVIYDIFDFYADHLRVTPGPVKRVIRTIDLWAIGRTDAVILADDSRLRQIADSSPRRCIVIHNSPQDVLGQGAKAVPEAGRHPLRLAYVGLLQVERGLIELLDVLARHPEWTLDLAGFGGDEALLLHRAAQLPNVHWHGRVPYDQALKLSAAADVLFATYDPTIPNHRYASPNKVFEAMMLGRPIIVARATNMDLLIDKHAAGLVVPYGDTDALEAALLQLESQPDLRQRLGAGGRRAYESHYSWALMERRLLDLYAEIIPLS